jgi:hypothetical protein
MGKYSSNIQRIPSFGQEHTNDLQGIVLLEMVHLGFVTERDREITGGKVGTRHQTMLGVEWAVLYSAAQSGGQNDRAHSHAEETRWTVAYIFICLLSSCFSRRHAAYTDLQF